MPAANPLVAYNTGVTSGLMAGTTYAANPATAPSMSSGQHSSAADIVGGNANTTVAGLVGISLLLLLGFHLLGFRFAFDVSVGRKG
jgi:hypothetical protein